MANSTIKISIGDIVKLVKKPELGSQVGEVLEITGSKIKYGFGVVNDGVFMPRATLDKTSGGLIHSIDIPQSDVASIIIKGDTRKMAKKLRDEQVNPLEKPSAKKAAKGKGTAKPSATETEADKALREAEEKAQAAQLELKKAKAEADKKAKKEKLEADRKAEKEKKEKEAAKTKNKERSDELKKFAKEAKLKEAEVVAQFSKDTEGKSAFLQLENFGVIYKDIKKFLNDKIKDNKKNESLALKTNLSDEEEVERKRLEASIRSQLKSFAQAGFEIGAGLTIINQHRLYRSTHKRFEDYVVEVFDLSQAQAYSVMAAAKTFQAISGDKKFNLKDMPSIRAAEAISKGVDRMIADTGLKTDPEVQAVTQQLSRNVFALASQTAPVDAKTGKAILSPAHITSVFNVVNDIAKTGTVDVDGKAVPLNLAKAAIGEEIAKQSAERQKQLNQYLAEQVEKKRGAFAGQPQDRASITRLNSALNSATGEVDIPEGVTPRITTTCSVHARQGVAEMTEQFIELECGCHFSMTTEGLSFTGNAKIDARKKAEAKAAKKDEKSTGAPVEAPADIPASV